MRTAGLVATGIPILITVSGCAPAVLKERPAAWPESWKGRRLFHTPRAYIYASSPEQAGQMDRIANEVTRDFERETHRTASKGLLLVTDLKDAPACADLEALLAAQKRSELTREKGRPPTDEELQKSREGLGDMKEKTGLELADAVGMIAISVNATELEQLLGFPSEVAREARWGAIFPTDALIAAKCSKVMSAAMEKSKMGPVARLAMAPLMLSIQPRIVEMMGVTRQAVLFEQMARQQADWSEQQVAKFAEAYSEGKLGRVASALVADVEAKSGKPAAPSSRPATVPATCPGSAAANS